MTTNQTIATFGVVTALMGIQTTIILWTVNARFSALAELLNEKFNTIDRRLTEIEKAMPRKLVP